MLFNSLEFIIFAVLFFGFFPFVRGRQTPRYLYICLFSFLFYGWWDWRFIILLIFTGLIDFLAGLGMEKYHSHRRLILIVSLSSNLLTLGFFKYFNFFALNFNTASIFTGLNWRIPLLTLVLPVGISFYTFQSMSYTIDIYRGELRATRNLFHFFAALSLFPHLVAGPIMRAAKLLPQLEQDLRPTEPQKWAALRLISHGFVKKMVIADNLAPTVNAAFSGPVLAHSSLEWWLIVTMFAFQIYCDFSGYSDIARGLAKWMGYEFTLNFNHPYTATSIRDFWSRWHISLSTWFRDYVYIPLGGSRGTPVRVHLNMWLTMLLSGCWHGAAWTYIAWGLLHAFYLTVERITRWPDRVARISGGKVIACMAVLLQVWIGWVFFRAESFSQALDILSVMFTFHGASMALSKNALVFLTLIVARECYVALRLDWRRLVNRELLPQAEPLALAAAGLAAVYLRGPGSAFIYFQF